MPRFYAIVSLLIITTTQSYCGPQMEFDLTTFDCGTILDGSTDQLMALFTVKNTGDSLLKLESVRPACGCTVVKFDSVLEPGASSKIEAQVRIKGYPAGPLSKTITVTSNAQNGQMVRLTIHAFIRAIIGISENFIELTARDSLAEKTLWLTSMKQDLAVSTISFKLDKPPLFSLQKAINITFDFTPTDSVVNEGNRLYKLSLNVPALQKVSSGRFIVKTNHPDKKQLVLRGWIGKSGDKEQ